MSDTSSVLDPELRVSPKAVLVGFLIAWFLLAVGAMMLSVPYDVLAVCADLFLLVCVLVPAGWVLTEWNPQVGRWFILLAIVGMTHLTSLRLGAPWLLILVALPIAVAAPLISFAAAVACAAAESVLLAGLALHLDGDLSFRWAATAIASTWGTLGLMYTVYHPMGRLRLWIEEYFERAQFLLEEARDRQVELEQALESLAQANRRLALANERITALREIAEDAQRVKTTFVSNVSHEFRTPLNMIIGLVELMAETPEIYSVVLSPKMRDDLEAVYSNCRHLAAMINDVLDLTRIEAGRLALRRERVDLREIVESSVTAVRPLMETKQLYLRSVVPDDLPTVYCDRVRIEQVILNLVSNAARFTEQGGITLEIVRQNQHLLVSVSDTGPGIASSDIKRIFEPFSQAEAQIAHDRSGSGLGLSISMDFVKMHGGRMWLESEVGAGSTFYFTLPVSPPVDHIARPGHTIREDWIWHEHTFRPEREGHTEGLLKPRFVLYDETGVLYPQFTRYTDGVEFVDTRTLDGTLKALEECPARAIILNAPAPEAAWPLVDEIRNRAPGTPIIGCAVAQPLERAVDAGALGYLIKPVMRADLEKVLAAVGKPVRHVLVVDDARDVLRLFDSMLHVCDDRLEVTTASSGEAALTVLERMTPDLMLLDIVMPGMDGWHVLEAMARDERLKSIPVYLVSAQDPSERPLISELCLATVKGGVPLNRLLRWSQEASTLLLAPESTSDPEPE